MQSPHNILLRNFCIATFYRAGALLQEIIGAHEKLIAFDYPLLGEDLAEDVIGKGHSYGKVACDIADFVANIKWKSVINAENRCNPHLLKLRRFYMPLGKQRTAGFIQVPKLNIHRTGRLYYIAFIINRLDIDNQPFLFACLIVIQTCIPRNPKGLEIVKAFKF